VHDANRNEVCVCVCVYYREECMAPTVTQGVCVCVCVCARVYRQTSLRFFVNAWRECDLLVDGVCDDTEGCNMTSYRVTARVADIGANVLLKMCK